jgi:hypothetical protein
VKSKGTVALLLLHSVSASAMTFGIGVSSTERIYTPVWTTQSWLLEPAFGWGASELSYTQVTTKSRGTHLGLGAFYLAEPTKPLSLYFGARAWQERTHASAGDGSGRTRSKGVAPTAGVQYRLGPSIAMSGELFYSYYKSKIDSSGNFGAAPSDSTLRTQAVSAQVVIRYYFGGPE